MTTAPSKPQDEQELTSEGCYVALTHSPLDITSTLSRVRSPQAGAIVLFAGTTRDNFAGQPVKELQYSAYAPLALRSMHTIVASVRERHALQGIAMIHRLGVVPVGEESILIAVSSPHRQAAWRAGEEALEECKERVEVWKREEFGDGGGGWRANRDGKVGVRVDGGEDEDERGEERKVEEGGGNDDDEVPAGGPVLRHARLGERGHGPVVNLNPNVQSERSP